MHLDLHSQMDLFLCKTHFCQRLMKQYVRAHNLKAEVWYMGHTSLDPTVAQLHRRRWRRSWLSAWDHGSSSSSTSGGSIPGSGSEAMPSTAGGGGPSRGAEQLAPVALQLQHWPDYSQVLHVKGKSGLKHSKQVLECWSQHADFPQLTVIGDNPFDEGPTQAVLDKRNVVLIPRPLPRQPPVPRRPQPNDGQHVLDGALGGAGDATGVHVVRGHLDPQLTTFDDIRRLEVGAECALVLKHGWPAAFAGQCVKVLQAEPTCTS